MNTMALAVDPLALHVIVPPATLAEARVFRDDLTRLLHRERSAAADFLVALADFDRRRGWERLGHASLFAFLTRELGLSNGAAYLRFTAAWLLPRFPEVDSALRDGRLCLSAVGELSRVLTPENQGEVLPRFYGRSSREAREVAAALAPRAEPPRREVVTPLVRQEQPPPSLRLAAPSAGGSAGSDSAQAAGPVAAAARRPIPLSCARSSPDPPRTGHAAGRRRAARRRPAPAPRHRLPPPARQARPGAHRPLPRPPGRHDGAGAGGSARSAP